MTSNYETVMQCVKSIQEKAPGFTPKFGIVLGSGLGPLADDIKDSVEISYENIPGFPISTVEGHHGSLLLGFLEGVPVACLKGRVHIYEGIPLEKLRTLIRTLKMLGCHSVLTTNAVGSIRKEVTAGQIALVTDHINFQFCNALIGPNDEEFGPRFFSMADAYDPYLRGKFKVVGKALDIPVHDSVYVGTTGPNFETPAEIKMFRAMGGDIVGMSTVQEVLVARHCDLRVVTLSAVTNLAADIAEEHLTHEGTLHFAGIASKNMCKLVKAFFKENADEFSK